jgi:putative ABC transport system substrate-binding protein
MRRREFIAGLGSASAWSVVARAQQPTMPVIGFVDSGSADAGAGNVATFRKGLGETGHVEGQNVTVEYHWLEGQFDRLPALMADLVRRRVACARAAAGSRRDPNCIRTSVRSSGREAGAGFGEARW